MPLVHGGFWSEEVTLNDDRLVGGMPDLEISFRVRSSVERKIGIPLYRSMVRLLHKEGSARRVVWHRYRNWWWTIRNNRSMVDDTVDDASFHILATDCMMQDAGVDLNIWRRMTQCVSSGCVCEDCDLVQGDRLAKRVAITGAVDLRSLADRFGALAAGGDFKSSWRALGVGCF